MCQFELVTLSEVEGREPDYHFKEHFSTPLELTKPWVYLSMHFKN